MFILSVEVLFGASNKLFENMDLKGFRMPKWSLNLKHLAYVVTLSYFLLFKGNRWR